MHRAARLSNVLVFLVVLLSLGTGVPMVAADASDLQELERLAEDSFAQDDLVTATALYRQLAERLDPTREVDRAERVRVQMIVAWLEHLRGRDVAALQALTEALILDPDYAYQPELYDRPFSRLYDDARQRASQQRQADASRFAREGSDRLRAGDTDGARELYRKALDAWPDETS
ncbi:MAG: hypothetical protein AAGE94_10515, partial [Acidobacteriota bacterium]